MLIAEKTCPVCSNFYPIRDVKISQLGSVGKGYFVETCNYCKNSIYVEYRVLNKDIRIDTTLLDMEN